MVDIMGKAAMFSCYWVVLSKRWIASNQYCDGPTTTLGIGKLARPPNMTPEKAVDLCRPLHAPAEVAMAIQVLNEVEALTDISVLEVTVDWQNNQEVKDFTGEEFQ